MSQILQPPYLPLPSLKCLKLQVVTRALYISGGFVFPPPPLSSNLSSPPAARRGLSQAPFRRLRFLPPLKGSWHGLLAFIFHRGSKILSSCGVLSIFCSEAQCHIWEMSCPCESLCFPSLNRTGCWKMKEGMKFGYQNAKSVAPGTH